VDFCKSRRELFSGILESLIISLFFEFREFGIQRGLLFQKVISPDVGFQNRVNGFGFIANNLESFI